jgi:hypothetical protein
MVNYMLLKMSLIALLIAAVAIFLVAIELGYRLGKRRQGNSDEPDKSHTNALQGAMLGLLALLLGFTFAMAVTRFDNRKTVITAQANAIGTAELRSRLLGAPYAGKAAPLFRAYVQAWMDYRAARIDLEAIAAAERRAFELEEQIWELVREANEADPHSLSVSLFTAAVNDMIDMHEKRVRSVEDRVPDAVIVLLFVVSVLALGQVAYSSGLRGRRNEIANVTFAFVIALVLVIILDIDRPRRGLVQVSHESMVRLQQSLEPAPR